MNIKQIAKYLLYLKVKFVKYIKIKLIFYMWYKWNACAKIKKDNVIFIVPGTKEDKLDRNILSVKDFINKAYVLNIDICYQGQYKLHGIKYFLNCIQVIKKLAIAHYVFICDANNVINALPIREECVIIQLWHACGAFKKFGFSTAELLFGESRKEKEQYPSYGKETYVTVSSPEVIWAYAEAMGIEKEKVRPIGVSRTDIYFDQAFLDESRRKLHALLPQTKKKKILLYAPTFRGSIGCAAAPEELSIASFQSRFADAYILLIKHHPFVAHRPAIDEPYRDFAVDCTELMDIEELLCVADICISDYSSLIYEFSLFQKPMVFLAHDLEEYFDWRGFYYDYNQMTPGPVCRSNEELLDVIANIENEFDRQQVEAFRNRFMSACDGHSTERIVRLAFGGLGKLAVRAGETMGESA